MIFYNAFHSSTTFTNAKWSKARMCSRNELICINSPLLQMQHKQSILFQIFQNTIDCPHSIPMNIHLLTISNTINWKKCKKKKQTLKLSRSLTLKLASHKHTISQGKELFPSTQEKKMKKHSMHLQPKEIVILSKLILIFLSMQIVILG